MVDALQDDVLKQVEEARTEAAAGSDQERQHMVARALLSVQQDVVAKYGFAGDAGYAQAQCSMEHAADAVVTGSTPR